MLRLLLHHLRHGACQARLQGWRVVGLAGLPGAEHGVQVYRHRQTAGVGREDAVRAPLHLLVLHAACDATPRPFSRWPGQGERWDGGRRLAVVGGLFIRISILNELGLIPGAREYVETRG